MTDELDALFNQFFDCSGAYRLFSKQRVDVSKMLNIVQSNVLQETTCLPYIVAHMDDTVIKKTGKRIPGTAWRRDPLGPHFQTNFIWGNASSKCPLPSRVKGKSANHDLSSLIFTIAQLLLGPGKRQKKSKGKRTKKRKK